MPCSACGGGNSHAYTLHGSQSAKYKPLVWRKATAVKKRQRVRRSQPQRKVVYVKDKSRRSYQRMNFGKGAGF